MRNYVQFWSSKILLSGNYANSVIAPTEEECEIKTAAVLAAFPTATTVWRNKPGYFLMNKANVCALLDLVADHYNSFFTGSYVFFQDGRFDAFDSPREVWSHGE